MQQESLTSIGQQHQLTSSICDISIAPDVETLTGVMTTTLTLSLYEIVHRSCVRM